MVQPRLGNAHRMWTQDKANNACPGRCFQLSSFRQSFFINFVGKYGVGFRLITTSSSSKLLAEGQLMCTC